MLQVCRLFYLTHLLHSSFRDAIGAGDAAPQLFRLCKPAASRNDSGSGGLALAQDTPPRVEPEGGAPVERALPDGLQGLQPADRSCEVPLQELWPKEMEGDEGGGGAATGSRFAQVSKRKRRTET